MSETDDIIRFGPTGPEDTGLEEWETMDPAGLVSGTPVQRGHIYHQDEEAGYLTGIWDCTAFTAPMGPYGEDEFMLLLEGSLIMKMPDGEEITINEGDAFVIPKGLECQWIQPGYVRKVFMILDGPVPADADAPSLTRITVPDLKTAPSGGIEALRIDFTNAAGNMQIGLRACAAENLPARPVRENLLIHVLEGGLQLTSGGKTVQFVPGETAYIRQDSVVGWRTEAGTHLLQATYASA